MNTFELLSAGSTVLKEKKLCLSILIRDFAFKSFETKKTGYTSKFE